MSKDYLENAQSYNLSIRVKILTATLGVRNFTSKKMLGCNNVNASKLCT